MPGKQIPADYLSRIMAVHKSSMAQEGASKDESLPYLLKSAQPAFTPDTLRGAQESDTKIKTLACYLKFGAVPDSPNLRSFLKQNAASYALNPFGLVIDKKHRILVPPSLRQSLLIRAHDEAGHFAAEKTFATLKDTFVWEDMQKEIENYCKSCTVCSQAKPPHAYGHIPLGQFPTATRFNERLHIDCITNLPKCPVTNATAIFVISDAYSGYVMAKAITSPTATEISRVLLNDWIPAHGIPRTIVSDSGKENVNALVKDFCSYYQINHLTTPVGSSRSNGLVERRNRLLVEFLRKYLTTHTQKLLNWPELLPSFCLANNVTKQTHGFPPHFLVYGHAPNNPSLDLNF